ncbi:MAG: class I SAM-dependent methyltransferase [Anaerolineales bacterium]|nr:class I SAM-dependent methyltransferase [Anaerolineales bacterium]
MKDSVEIFSTRVQNYLKYRPKYPIALIKLLRTECLLGKTAVVADIGSGTGLLAELFLKNGNLVFGVEPNCDTLTIIDWRKQLVAEGGLFI